MLLTDQFDIAREDVLPHAGHKLAVAPYDNEEISIECEDCYCVLVTFPREEL